MTALWITEQDVVDVIDLVQASAAVRAALALEQQGRAQTMTKTSVVWGEGHTLHAIGAEAEGAGLVGTKTWAHTAGGATPLLVLWDSASGELRAVIEAFALGQLRTAAVSSVATDLLAKPDANVLAIIGSGKQALAQTAAVAAVRALDEIRVYSPTPAHRDAFAARVEQVGAAPLVRACASVDDAVDQAAIVTTVTRATDPFLKASMLGESTHVNALGAISPERRELSDDVAAVASLVVADNADDARRLSRELDGAEHILSLSAITGTKPGITLFKSMGIGLADVAVGSEVLARAERTSRGRPIPQPTKATPHLFGGQE
jgi:alanine dehydrogenase